MGACVFQASNAQNPEEHEKNVRRFSLRLLAQAGKFMPARKSLILTYHSIDPSGSLISIHPEVFRWQMAFLKNSGHKGISLKDYLTNKVDSSSQRLPRIVITFDDGFENFHEVALPILNEYGFRATVFVVTGAVCGKCTWERKSPINEFRLMQWNQIRECERQGIEIGSHTIDHVHLTQLNSHHMQRQIAKSKEQLESSLGTEVSSFCYPYGHYDYSTIIQVRAAGYKTAVTRRFKYLNAKSNHFELPRIGMNRIDPSDHVAQKLYFEVALNGTLNVYESIRNVSSAVRRS